MYSKKSVVLSGINDESQKGILSIEQSYDGVVGNVRLYNFNSEPNGILSLGIYNDDKVFKAGLTRISDMLFSFKSELKTIPQNFSCAIINFEGAQPKPLLYGNSNGYVSRDKIFDEVIGKLKELGTASEVEQVLDEYNIDYSDEEKKEIDEEIEKNFKKDDVELMCKNDEKDCENCKYKKYYFSNIASSEEQKKEEDEEEGEISFYEQMREHIDKLFASNPHEDYLEKFLPNSKFVKVEIEENNYYVLGLIYQEEKIKYICYGVPGIYQKNPPRQLSGNPIWFPLDENKIDGFGYWLSYQDAQSGESVKAIII